jgi:chromosome segregation ATPase
MIDNDTSNKLDSLDRTLDDLRQKTITLKTNIKSLYSEVNISNARRNTLERKFNKVVEALLDVDSVYKKQTRSLRQQLSEIVYAKNRQYTLDNMDVNA